MSWGNATTPLHYEGGVVGGGGLSRLPTATQCQNLRIHILLAGIFSPLNLGFTARPVKIISLILSRVNHKVARKQFFFCFIFVFCRLRCVCVGRGGSERGAGALKLQKSTK